MRLSMYILCLKIKDFFGQHMFSGMWHVLVCCLYFILSTISFNEMKRNGSPPAHQPDTLKVICSFNLLENTKL